MFAGIEVVCERLFGDESVKDRQVLVQGAGDVGGGLIGFLREAGADVLFSEEQRRCRQTLSRPPRIALRLSWGGIHNGVRHFCPMRFGGRAERHNTIPQLKCRAVAGSSNNQLEQEGDAEHLRSRGILYAPDYVINVGGVMAILGLEIQGWARGMAEKEVISSVRHALKRIFDSATAEGITTEAAARNIAEHRLHRVGAQARTHE